MANTANPTATFTRPNDTTAYATGDLVANSVTNTSVTPMSFVVTGNVHGPLFVRRVKIKKSTNVTTAAQFRLHLYASSPTVANGDNGAWSSSESGYYGSIDVTVDKAFTDPASNGVGVPQSGTGTEITVPGGTDLTIYGLLEARAAYAPGAQEVFTVILETYIGSIP